MNQPQKKIVEEETLSRQLIPIVPPKKIPETLGRGGAMALAKRLQDFWHNLGHTSALFWAEPIPERFEKVGSYEIYTVKSNLVDGLPPRFA